MVLIDRRSFLRLAGAAAFCFSNALRAYAQPSPAEQDLFDEVVRNPDGREAGQALVDGLVERLLGKRAHDNVDLFIYDPSYSQLEEDLKTVYRMQADDPDYIKYITGRLKSKGFFNECVNDYARLVEDQSLPESERVRNAAALLRGRDGPRQFLLSFAEHDANAEINFRYKDTFACTIKKRLTPGASTRSNCYFNRFNFQNLDLSQETDFAYRVDADELGRRMPFKPSLSVLEGTVLHEEKHAEQFSKGIFFGARRVNPPASMAGIRAEVTDAAIEVHSYLYELEYLRRQGDRAGAAYACMCLSLQINVLIPGWIRAFSNLEGEDSPELTRKERNFLKPYLAKAYELKGNVRTILAAEGLLAKEFTL